MNIIDVIYLIFSFTSIYFTSLFLLLFINNRHKMFEKKELKFLPSVSIIIPAYNEEKAIKKTINAVKNLAYPKKEIIVVDDGSTDRTAHIARRAGVKVIKKKNGGKASALNAGLKHAKGEIVACVDADSFPKKDALINAMPYFEDPKVAAVTSAIFVNNPKTFMEKLQNIEYTLIAWARKLFDFIESVYVTPGPFSLYRKDVLLKLGGFDEKNITEDIEIAWRLHKAGYKIKMSAVSECYTNVPTKVRKWWKQRIRWNIGGFQTTGKYKSTLFRPYYKSLGVFISPFFVLSYVLSIIGFAVFLSIAIKNISEFVVFSAAASSMGVNPMRYYNFMLLPNIYMIFGLIIFVLSLMQLYFGLKTMKKDKYTIKSYLGVLVYLSVYITLFPIILIKSIWNFIMHDNHEW